MSTSDGTCEGGGDGGLTFDGHARRGEGGRVEFSQWGPVGTTEPPTLSSCLRTDSDCKDLYPDNPHSLPDPNVCPTTKRLGPIPWVLGSGEKQLDLHTTVTIPRDPSFPLKMLVDSGSSGSLIDRHLVEKLGIPKIKLAHPRLLLNADHSKNDRITHVARLDVHIGSVKDSIIFVIANLGKAGAFLGFDWLERLNPVIDWRRRRATFPEPIPDTITLDDGDKVLWVDLETRATSSKTQPSDDHPNSSPLDRIPTHLHEFADVFLKEGFDELPPHREWDHAIELVPGAKLRDCKIYPLSPGQQRELDTFIEDNLSSQRIRPSKSPLASPFFFIQKKDGSLRPVQDYRYLNSVTIKNKYPLPLISDLIDKLKDATIFTKFDVRWGYNNVRIRPGDEWKAAFKTNRGLFEPRVMFFGLTNSPATFQAMMNKIFADEIREGHVVIYLDDILIFSTSLDEHRTLVARVLQKLRQNKLYLKPEKCEFEKETVDYLGMVVGGGEVRMEEKKVEAIREWSTPSRKKELQRFLGFVNFYRKFVKDFSMIARPLHELTGNSPWEWLPRHQAAFDTLKTAISDATILHTPHDTGKFKVEADSSDFAVGGTLSQLQEGRWKPIAFLSKSLSPAERNYEIYDKELLAIIICLDEWRQYILGAPDKFEVWSDHKNLEYFRKPQNINRRQARWVSILADYDFSLHHLPGSHNSAADALSRLPSHDDGSNDNTEVVVLKPTYFQVRATEEVESLETHIRSAQDARDPVVTRNQLRKPDQWRVDEDGTIWVKDKLYVPKDAVLRGEILQNHHDSPLAGHRGATVPRT